MPKKTAWIEKYVELNENNEEVEKERILQHLSPFQKEVLDSLKRIEAALSLKSVP